MQKLIFLLLFSLTSQAEDKKIDCSKEENERTQECLKLKCKPAETDFAIGEVVITYGETAVATVNGQEWQAGGHIEAVKTLYRTDGPGKGQAITVEYDYDYNHSIEDLACMTKVKTIGLGEKPFSMTHFYASEPNIVFRPSTTEKEKVEFKKAVGNKDPQIHGVSDLDKDGFQEIWYQVLRDRCSEIKVIELNPKKAEELVDFTFCKN